MADTAITAGHLIRVIPLLWLGSLAWGQSCAITSPTTTEPVSGYSFPLSVSINSIPNLARVVYTVDTVFAGQSLLAPWSVDWNPYNQLNGPHSVSATAYDSLGGVLATCPAVAFITANTNAMYGGKTPAFSVTPSTAFSSAWTGIVNLTFSSLSGLTAQIFVDGIQINQNAGTTPVFSVDTRAFNNGTHAVGWRIVSDKTLYKGKSSCDPGGQNTSLVDWGEGARSVTFSNGSAAMEVRTNAKEIWLAPGGTFPLTGRLYHTDESSSAATMQYYSQTPAIATVNPNTGVVTGITSTGGGSFGITCPSCLGGTGQIRATAIQSRFFDLEQHPASEVSSASYTFSGRDVGRVIYITGGAGWTTGAYEIAFVTGGKAVLQQNGANVNAAKSGTSGGAWQSGPSTTVYAYVRNSPTASIPHFSKSGAILTHGYSVGNSMAFASHFNPNGGSYAGFFDYNWPTFGSDLSASGMNAYEVACANSNGPTTSIYGLQTNWTSATPSLLNTAISNWVSQWTNLLAPYPNLRIHLHCESETRSNPSNVYPIMYGPASKFKPSAVTRFHQAWAATGIVVGSTEADESNAPGSMGSNPAAFPIIPGSFGFRNIVADGAGKCALNWNQQSFGFIDFLITGSVTPRLNSVSPNYYVFTKVDNNHGIFPCPGVAAGTYGASNDPGLTIQKFGYCWLSPATGGGPPFPPGPCSNQPGAGPYTDYVKSSFVADYAAWVRAASPTVAIAWPPLGSSLADTMSHYTTSIIGDYAEQYFQPTSYPYLTVKNSINALTNDIGNVFRTTWAGIGDAQPWLAEVQGQPTNYGFEGYAALNGRGSNLRITGCSDNTITFASDHGLRNIVPGLTRMTVTGSTGCDGNFIVISAPTSSTMRVALAAPNFTSSVTAPYTGIITFEDGSTFALKDMTATRGVFSHTQSEFTVTDFCSPHDMSREIGQTFTISGATPSSSGFNYPVSGNTFWYSTESWNFCTAGLVNNGQATYFHQIPSLSGSGGTVSIVQDYLFRRGVNFAFDADVDNDTMFVEAIYAYGLGAAGFRQYQLDTNPQAFSPTQGTVQVSEGYYNNFPDTCPVTKQLGAIGNFEASPLSPNSSTRGAFYAAGTAAKIATRVAPYLFQQRLPSPSYGSAFEAFARSGGPGKILMAINMTNSPQTRTFNLAPYLSPNQKMVRIMANWQGITTSILPANTSTTPVTVPAATAVFFLCPADFAAELQQPVIAARASDVPNATRVVVRYAYDLYNLDSASLSFDCGTGSCVAPVDRKIGTVYYRLLYLDATGKLVATSEVQTL